jgi:hypothetical protein
MSKSAKGSSPNSIASDIFSKLVPFGFLGLAFDAGYLQHRLRAPRELRNETGNQVAAAQTAAASLSGFTTA